MTAHKKALERIAQLCSKSDNPTHRTCRIYDVALEGLGFTHIQRITQIRSSLGNAAADNYLQHQEKARLRALAKDMKRKEKI
jgi:hypothetical protein